MTDSPEQWHVEHNCVIKGDSEIQVYRADDTAKLAHVVCDLLNARDELADLFGDDQ